MLSFKRVNGKTLQVTMWDFVNLMKRHYSNKWKCFLGKDTLLMTRLHRRKEICSVVFAVISFCPPLAFSGKSVKSREIMYCYVQKYLDKDTLLVIFLVTMNLK